MRRHPLLVATVAAIVAAAAVIAVLIVRDDDVSSSKPNDLSEVADSFPVPAGAVIAFPDTITDAIATKGWTATGTLDEACTVWREAYRGWTSAAAATGPGDVTGDYVPGQMCSLNGPKGSFRAELNVAVYGDDPRPSVTLTVRR